MRTSAIGVRLPPGTATRRALMLVAIANAGIAQALYLSLLVILPALARDLSSGGHKAVVLAIVAGTGAAVAMIAGVAAGGVSDWRRHLAGSRRPVHLAGAFTAAIFLTILPTARSAPVLVLIWCGAQVGLNCVLMVITTALLDWFSAADRGRASACAAAGQVCGALIASAAAFTIGGQVAVVSTLAG
ncbi:MAG TPA: hypothetical protein VFQ44_12035, partial [Streptosporangiaceae bacterium]|nr:hypothetical protein [Streptosporangiaceae bacterium]